jgi:hypothetical protein
MNALVIVAIVTGAFALGFGLGRYTFEAPSRSSHSRRFITRLTPPSARPRLRVITGGRIRRSAHG